jgi:hypothetical protein
MSRSVPLFLAFVFLASMASSPVFAQETAASPQESISFPDYQRQGLVRGLLFHNATTRAQAVRDYKLSAPNRSHHWWNRLGLVQRLTTPTKPGVRMYENQADYDADHGFQEVVILPQRN